MDFDTFDDRLLELADSLRGADEATVAAEAERMKELAEQIPDEQDRQLALIRVGKLDELIHGPKAPASPEYARASSLLAQVLRKQGTVAERIAHAERVKTEIAELSKQAPPRESMTILRLNSTIVRWIERLQNDLPDNES